MLPRRLFLAALPFIAATPARADLIRGNLTGDYRARGRYPDGRAYSGNARIEQQGSEIGIAWRIGGSTYTGTGLREDRVVAVDWGDKYPVVYVVMPDGELHGTWADGEALEKLGVG